MFFFSRLGAFFINRIRSRFFRVSGISGLRSVSERYREFGYVPASNQAENWVLASFLDEFRLGTIKLSVPADLHFQNFKSKSKKRFFFRNFENFEKIRIFLFFSKISKFRKNIVFWSDFF